MVNINKKKKITHIVITRDFNIYFFNVFLLHKHYVRNMKKNPLSYVHIFISISIVHE